ncbi:MAG TPA: radical SAM protein [Methylomirabilota bacterium]|jgi:pyruvate formate lyase activating enzyme|nr:radical SAM protein [Methylomirabilota bacterium]
MADTTVILEQILSRLAREGELYERLPGRRVLCYACGHRCVIPPGQRGICKVRWNQDGRLMVPAGYVAGLQLDPVEKKPFFHAHPGARALSFGMLGCDYHCAYCFTGDSPILTPAGFVRISAIFAQARPITADDQVRIADGVKVMAASGTPRPVLKAFRHRYQGPMTVVKPMYLPAIRCTPDHRWLASTDSGSGELTEVRAADLTPDYFLVVPKPPILSAGRITFDAADLLSHVTATFAIPRSLSPMEVQDIVRAGETEESSRSIGARLGKHPSYIRHVWSKVRRGRWVYEKTMGVVVEDDSIRFPNEHRPGIPRSLELDKTCARLLGLYCAEGSVIRSKRRPNSVRLVFCFGHAEHELRREVVDSLRRVFGVRPAEVHRPTTPAVEVGKSSLALLFESLCGTGAGNKRVPRELFAADPSIQEAFLDACVGGDGHRYTATGKLSVTTVSRDLAYGIAALVLHSGRLPSIYVASKAPDGWIMGRAIRRQPEEFSVVWYRDPRPSRKLREADHHFLVPITSVTIEPFDGDVFNLEVEEEHSYVAGFCAVKNCQNALTSQALRDPAMGVEPQQVSPAQIVEAAVKHRARILTSTYNEPLITSEWAVEVFRAGKARGLTCSYVSNGNATPEALDYLRPWVDLYKVDLKGFDDKRYRKLGGVLGTVLESIRGLHAKGFWLEIVTLLIPGFNDSDDEIRDIARFLVSVSPEIPWHVTAFHRDYKMTDREDTPARTLLRAAEIGRGEGLHYVYAGNLPGRVREFENTYCPACRTLLIERAGYTILEDRLTPTRGRCPACSRRIPGVWG